MNTALQIWISTDMNTALQIWLDIRAWWVGWGYGRCQCTGEKGRGEKGRDVAEGLPPIDGISLQTQISFDIEAGPEVDINGCPVGWGSGWYMGWGYA